MSYRALYRTYRPQDFNEVAGQKHVTVTLQNALKSGKVQHAYLFSGPRGTGKTSIAKIFAKAVNCESAPIDNPCNHCDNCRGIQDGSISDVIEIDAASNNGVDEIREIRDKVKYLPGYVKHKVYIIDEVHMLSTGAFNALLKTLEEPPAHVIFILCTTEPQKIPLTIQSRCQRFDFKAITVPDIVGKLTDIVKQEQIPITQEAIEQIAVYADGGLRDAIGLLDQAVSYSPEHITIDDVNQICGAVSYETQIKMIDAISHFNPSLAIELMDQLIVEGKEVQKIVDNLLVFFRDLLFVKNMSHSSLKQGSLFTNNDFLQLAKELSNQRIFMYMDILNQAMNDMKWSNNPKLILEIALMKTADAEEGSQVHLIKEIEDLQKRIQKLENSPVVPVTIEKPVELEPKKEAIIIEEVKPVEIVEEIEAEEDNQEIKSEPEKVDSEEDCDDISNTYSIHFVEQVLNNGDRDDKNHLQNQWYLLSKYNPTGLYNQFAIILESGSIVASSIDKVILTFDSPVACNKLMKPSSVKISKEVLKNAFGRDIEYIALPTEVFKEIASEFLSEWKKDKTKTITLKPIKCSELKDVSKEIETEEIKENEKKIVTDAHKIFKDIVTVKK